MQYSEIYSAVEDVLKLSGGSKRDIAKHAVNMAYIEMMFNDVRFPPYWLHAPLRRALHAPKTVEDASQAAQCVITSTAHGFSGGEVLTFWNVGGMEELNYDYATASQDTVKLYVVDTAGIAADTFRLTDMNGDAINSTTYTAFTTGGTIHHHGWRIASVIHTVHKVGLYDNNPLVSMTWEQFLDDPDYWVSDQTTTPYKFIHSQLYASDGDRADYIITLPASQEAEIAYPLITVKPIILSSDTDVPLMPPEFHYGIVAGAVMRLMESNVQVENAVIWPGIYQANVAGFNAYNYKLWETAKGSDPDPVLL